MTTRGLEPAGVDLQARGFKQYIDRLQKIDKQQQEIFGAQPKGIKRSFSRAEKAAKDYESQIKRTQQIQRSFNQILGQLAFGVLTKETAEFVLQSAQMAAAFRGQREALTNLAASYGQSGNEIRQAITRAADGVLSQTRIIDVALQGTQLQVARTPEEFERLTAALIRIGQARGIGGQAAVERGFLGIGKRETELLDELGITTRQINNEMDKLAKQRFDATVGSLSNAQREALFVEAAITVAEEAAARFGNSSVEAAASFERMNAEAENLKLVFGEAVLPTTSQFSNLLTDAAIAAQQLLAFISAGAAGFGVILDRLGVTVNIFERLQQLGKGEIGLGEAITGFDPGEFVEGIGNIDEVLDEAAQTSLERFKDIARAQGAAFPEDIANEATNSIIENTEALEQNEELLKSLQSAILQAEQLELSFARAAEDAARRLARQQAKLARDQFKDRIDLLNDQAKEFDQFQKDELKSVQEAEAELNEAREKAGKERLREQNKLHRELRQARDRFNLDAIQSQRRFDLQDRRLRAAGDILALQELREDFALQQQEAKENFNLQNKQRKEDAKEQQAVANENRQERIAELEQELADLQSGLDQRRAEFLAAQQEEFNNLKAAQAEQRLALQESYLEQQEDARINQQRQLEDLGRSLAAQEDLTAEGAAKIAEELEKIFGIEGAADTILSGFTTRSESEFRDLFNNIEEIIKATSESLDTFGAGATGGLGANPSLQLGQTPSFHQGGVVPGPRGSEQVIRALGGETVLPTHQMNAPIVPSQNLNVNMSGGFNITGAEGVSARVKQEAITEMTEAFEIAVRRLGRRI